MASTAVFMALIASFPQSIVVLLTTPSPSISKATADTLAVPPRHHIELSIFNKHAVFSFQFSFSYLTVAQLVIQKNTTWNQNYEASVHHKSFIFCAPDSAQ